MLIDAIYDNGRLLFPKQYSFAHQRFNLKVELPETEIIEKNVTTCNQESATSNDVNLNTADEISSLIATNQYPVEFLEFKKLQDAIFGKDYVYVQKATDKELMQQHWIEEYA